MTVGKIDNPALSAEITGVGPHDVAPLPIDPNIDSISTVQANISAFIPGMPGDGFAGILACTARMKAGTLTVSGVTNVVALQGFGGGTTAMATLVASGDNVAVRVTGVPMTTFDVDVRWDRWGTQ